MTWLNAHLNPLFDLCQRPFAGLPALVGIVVWSIPTGVFALWIFKRTSNQERIDAVKQQIYACLFEIRLFNDSLRAIARAQGEILRHVLVYQALALKPMLWILPPLVLVMVQLHAFYGYRPLQVGESVLVRVELADPTGERSATRPEVALELPEGLEAETPPLWIPTLGEVDWRVGAASWGDFEIAVRVGSERLTKHLRVADRVVRVSPVRPPRSFVEELEWPSEPPLPRGHTIRSISVDYSERTIDLFGWRFEWAYAWMVVFFALTMVVAVALKGPMGVTL